MESVYYLSWYRELLELFLLHTYLVYYGCVTLLYEPFLIMEHPRVIFKQTRILVNVYKQVQYREEVLYVLMELLGNLGLWM